MIDGKPIIYRVQDAEGRGPWRPGFSHLWVRERADHNSLQAAWQEFGLQLFRTCNGCGCRSLEQLRRWFTPEEYADLLGFGYQAVRMDVDRIVAQGPTQAVFQRARALRFGAEPVSLYGASSVSPVAQQTELKE